MSLAVPPLLPRARPPLEIYHRSALVAMLSIITPVHRTVMDIGPLHEAHPGGDRQ